MALLDVGAGSGDQVDHMFDSIETGAFRYIDRCRSAIGC